MPTPGRARFIGTHLKRRFGVVAVLAGCLLPAAVSAAPSAELWPRWQAHDRTSTQSVDHSAWTALLKKHVVTGGVNRFAYGNLDPADRSRLGSYVASLAGVKVSSLNRGEQKAYWINLYNALTVRTVVARYPVKSIRDIDISPGLLADGPWDKKLVTVEGAALSLNDIEHRILRPVWRDPRVHYAVNCASIGCPNLQPVAFTADTTEQLLDIAARQYVNHPRGAMVEGGKLKVSSIYHWYGEDFGGSDAAIIRHLKRYAVPALAKKLETVTGISGHRYDWSLNDAR